MLQLLHEDGDLVNEDGSRLTWRKMKRRKMGKKGVMHLVEKQWKGEGLVVVGRLRTKRQDSQRQGKVGQPILPHRVLSEWQ